jgi:putative ABC transport system permease protein
LEYRLKIHCYFSLMTFHTTLYDLVSLATLSVGLTFALLLWFTPKADRGAYRYLSVALIVVLFCLGWQFLIDIYLPVNIAPLTFLLSFGPLLYLFIRNITNTDVKFKRKDAIYFAPLILQFIVFLWLVILLPFAVMLSVIVYLALSIYHLRQTNRQMKFSGGDRYRLEWRWLQYPVLAMMLLSPLIFINSVVFILLLTVVMIWLAVTSYFRPEAVAVKQSDASELREKSIWLKKAVKENRYYEDPDLSLPVLAGKVGMVPHELSRIINTIFKKSFTDFINEFRVADVIRKMKNPANGHLTLLGMAYDAGFNSQSTFHRAFKEITGKTPAEYKKELPSYNLTHHTAVAPLISSRKLNRDFMFKNYLKMAWRNILYNKGYSALNITGLAAGMAVALLIGLWVNDQYAYDRFLTNYQQASQVEMNLTSQHTGTSTQTSIALPLTDVLKKQIPGIKYVAETDNIGRESHGLMVGDKKLYLEGGAAGADFFNILQYPFVEGQPATALKSLYSIVLTQSTAKALFGDADPMGKEVRFDNAHDLTLTGIIRDIPNNASLKFNYITPFAYKEATEDWVKTGRTKWTWNSFSAYVALEPNVTYAQVAPKIKDIVLRESPEMRPAKPEVFLYPVKEWHLYNEFKNGKIAGGFVDYVRLFSIIGLFVLAIACINFMNLSTARSEKRAREVGVRKAIGSGRFDLVYQFLLESVLITSLSFLLCLLFVLFALPAFNELTGSDIHIPYGNIGFWGIMIGFILLTGLAAGSRPAFYLSSFSAVKVLKGSIHLGKAATLPRKILVVAQFTCSVALIISTMIVYEQIGFVKNRPTGYNADRLVMTDMNGDLYKNYDALRNELLSKGLVEKVSSSTSPATQVYSHFALEKWPGKDANDEGVNIGAIWVSNDYFQTLGMTMAAGREFEGDPKNDSLNVILNEAAVKRIGLKDPVGQLISWNGSDQPVRIIGVVKDVLMESPYKPVEPAIFGHAPNGSIVTYRLPKNADTHTVIENIGKVFEKYNPAYPFQYKFIDEEYARKFDLEVLVGKLAGVFAGLAIFISCLGLFGLAAYIAEQRTKEIGIRKVLGASISQVWALLSREFVLLVVISCLIASPLAFFFLSHWLQQYPYHVHMGPGVFLISGAAAVLITLFTISFQAIKAALANPVKSLRSE